MLRDHVYDVFLYDGFYDDFSYDGCLVQPRLAHFLDKTLTIPCLACWAQTSRFLLSSISLCMPYDGCLVQPSLAHFFLLRTPTNPCWAYWTKESGFLLPSMPYDGHLVQPLCLVGAFGFTADVDHSLLAMLGAELSILLAAFYAICHTIAVWCNPDWRIFRLRHRPFPAWRAGRRTLVSGCVLHHMAAA